MVEILKNKKGPISFFYHFNKHTKKITLHAKKRCISIDDLVVWCPTSSKFNKRQPYFVMKGVASEIRIDVQNNEVTAHVLNPTS